MPKLKYPTNQVRSGAARGPSPALRNGANAVHVNPILYQPIALTSDPFGPLARAAGEPEKAPSKPDDVQRLIRTDGESGFISVLSHRLPEPTSYAGKNVIALDFPPQFFCERPNQSQLLEFDGTMYVDCGNPPQLQGRAGSSLTIEAWIRADGADGWQHIVTHGQTRSGNKGAEVFLRIREGIFEFGTWDGEKNSGVHEGAAKSADVTPPPSPPNPQLPWFQMIRTISPGWGRDPVTGQLLPISQIKENRPAPPPASIADKLRVRSEDLRVWVHLAGVYDHTAKTYTLYRNGSALASFKEETAPLAVSANWFIGAMKDEEPKVKAMDRFFKGGIAEVRIWTVARTAQQIRRHMVDNAPPAFPGELGAYWRLTDGQGHKARDISGRDCDGDLVGGGKRGKEIWNWGTSPTGELVHLARRQPPDEVKEAFEFAQKNGFFDPLVFPRIRGVMTQAERAKAKDALKDLSFDTFLSFYLTGYHLILRRAFSGDTEYAFVPNPPQTVRPQLVLIEEYRLSSFLGSYGVGRTLKSFSLLPGERTKLTIKTASKTATTTKESQSILDSYSKESASEFENSLSEEKSNRSSSSDEQSYHASVEASGSWGFGSASASAGAEGSSNSAREDFAKSVSNATAKHAAKASASRNVQIDTMTETQKTIDQTSEIVRDIENINVGRTLNFVFCQANQEFLTLLHLVDVRVGYTNGVDAARETPLYELPELLARVMADSPEGREIAQTRIIGELQLIRDYRGTVPPDFITGIKGSAAKPARYTVNRDFVSNYGDPGRNGFTVPGIIVSAKSIVMRTEDVVVDALIGEGSALDGYAKSLQQEENRTKRLANDAAALANRLMAVELKRNNLLLKLAENKEIELLKAYTEATRAMPPGIPNRMVGVWESDPKVPLGNGSAKYR